MAKSPSYPFNRTLPEVIGDIRRPRSMPETGWHFIGPTNEQGVNWQNGCSGDSDRPPAYMLGEDGFVRHKGLMSLPSSPTFPIIAYTLPIECRPAYPEDFLIGIKGGGYANGYVDTNGDVVIEKVTTS